MIRCPKTTWFCPRVPWLRSLARSLAHFAHSLARGKVIFWCLKMTWFCPIVDWVTREWSRQRNKFHLNGETRFAFWRDAASQCSCSNRIAQMLLHYWNSCFSIIIQMLLHYRNSWSCLSVIAQKAAALLKLTLQHHRSKAAALPKLRLQHYSLNAAAALPLQLCYSFSHCGSLLKCCNINKSYAASSCCLVAVMCIILCIDDWMLDLLVVIMEKGSWKVVKDISATFWRQKKQ